MSLHVHLSIFAFLWKFALGKLWCNDLNTECSSANQTNNTLASLHVYLRRASSSVMSSTLSAWPVAQRCPAKQTDDTLVSLHVHICISASLTGLLWANSGAIQHCSSLSAWPVAQLLCKTDRQHHLCPCMHTSAYCFAYVPAVGKIYCSGSGKPCVTGSSPEKLTS
ncbi:hypothetical protein ABBQ38_006639 [Trebouxia sp. C0009 RCD-2024]